MIDRTSIAIGPAIRPDQQAGPRHETTQHHAVPVATSAKGRASGVIAGSAGPSPPLPDIEVIDSVCELDVELWFG